MAKYLFLIFFLAGSTSLLAQETIISYHPSEPQNIEVDTVVGEMIFKWNYSNSKDNFIIQKYNDGNKRFEYRYLNSTAIVEINGHLIEINKMTFKDSIDFDYSDEFILHRFDLQNVDQDSGELEFFVTVTKPDTDWTYPFNLFINQEGELRFTLMLDEEEI